MTTTLSTIKTFLQLSIVDDNADLTNRQMAILLTIYDGKDEYSIKKLTEELHLTKPTISRAVERLLELDLVSKRTNPKDRRRVIVEKTFDGNVFIETLTKYLKEANDKYYEMLFRMTPYESLNR